MATRIGINGFGRIGRLSLRTILERHPENLEVVAVNDLVPADVNAHLFKYDTIYGEFAGLVSHGDGAIKVNRKDIKVFAEKDPAAIDWPSLGVEIVLECTGLFTDATKAVAHKRGSVKKVVISAPAKNEDVTIVLGVNDAMYAPKSPHVISNASCTTNGLAPVAMVLHKEFGIEKGLLTTIHAYTNSQATVDTAKKGLRDSRAAAENIATGQASGREVYDGWVRSRGHRTNLENCAYTHHGIGLYQNRWTHVFARC